MPMPSPPPPAAGAARASSRRNAATALPPGLHRLFPRVTAFALVGVLNTAVSYALFSLFVFLGVHYSLALFVAAVLSVLFGFLTQGNLVFGNNHPRRLWRFVTAYSLLYGLNLMLLAVFRHFQVNLYLAQLASLVPVVGLAYLANAWWVFRPEAGKESP